MTDKQYTKQLKSLKRAYKKQLKQLATINPLEYLIVSLRYLRDFYILTEPLELDEEGDTTNVNILSTESAIMAYEASIQCVSKYFEIDNDSATTDSYCLRPKAEYASYEDAQQAYEEESKQHWETFWGFCMMNMRYWEEDFYDFLQ